MLTSVGGGHAILIPLYWLSAGVSLFAAIHSTVLGIIGHRRWLHLPFAMASLGAMLLEIGSAWLFSAGNLADGILAEKIVHAGASLLLPGIALTVSAYVRRPRPPLLIWLFVGLMTLMFIINLVSPCSVRYSTLSMGPPVTLPWGEVIAQYRGASSIWTLPTRYAVFAVWIWSTLQAIRQIRAGERLPGWLLLLGILSVAISHLWNILVTAQLIHSAYFTGIAYQILIVAISISISLDLRRTTLDNVELDRLVSRRTGELQADVERRKKIEFTLRTTQTRLRAALESGGVGTWVFDGQKPTIWWDDSTFRLWGHAPGPDNNVGRELVFNTIVEEDRDMVRDKVAVAGRDMSPYSGEFRIRRADGSLRWLASRGLPLTDPENGHRFLAGASFDITDRKRGELLIAGHKQVLSMIVGGQPLAAILETLIATLEAMNPGILCAVVLAKGAQGQPEVVAAPRLPEDLKRMTAGASPFGRSIAVGSRLQIDELDPGGNQGSWAAPLLAAGFKTINSTPIPDSKGQIVGALDLLGMRPRALTPEGRVFIDSTVQVAAIAIESARAAMELRQVHSDLDRKVGERTQALHAANEKLRDLDRLKAGFLANMSHELRTPLNAVVGFTDNLLMRAPGPLTHDQERQLGIIRGSAQTLLRLISELLDLAKLEADRMSLQPGMVVCQEQLTDAVRRQQAAAAARKLTIDAEMPATPLQVFCDPRALGEVLTVLLSAAIRLAAGDRLTVALVERGTGDQRRILFELQGLEQKRISAAQGAGGWAAGEDEEALALAQRFAGLIGGVLELQWGGKGGCLALSLPAGA